MYEDKNIWTELDFNWIYRNDQIESGIKTKEELTELINRNIHNITEKIDDGYNNERWECISVYAKLAKELNEPNSVVLISYD